MITRTVDATRINALLNDPTIRPTAGPISGVTDLTAFVRDTANVCFVTPHGAILYAWKQPCVYEVHSLFLPDGRGIESQTATSDAIDFMFTQTDCTEIQTRFAMSNHGALGLTRAMGFEKRFIRQRAWEDADGWQDVCYWALPIERWALGNAACLVAGQRFHERLALADVPDQHSEDIPHDHIAGLAARLLINGLSVKALTVYNRWALLAGYAELKLMREFPPTVYTGNALVTVAHGSIEVL